MGDDASVVGALAAGADGYLLKDQPSALLVRQIRQMIDGVPALSPAIARRIMTHFRRTGPDMAETDLTRREREVLGQYRQGAAQSTRLPRHSASAPNTVAAHIKSVYAKLGISSSRRGRLACGQAGALKHLKAAGVAAIRVPSVPVVTTSVPPRASIRRCMLPRPRPLRGSSPSNP